MEKKRELVRLMMDISKALRCCQQDEVLCEYLTFFQFYIMDTIAARSRLQLAELHNILAVDKSTTTRLVDPLVKRHLVIREKSDDDSRAVVLKLSQQGQEIHGKVWHCIGDFLESVEGHIPKDKRETVYESVKLFTDAMLTSCKGHHCK